MPTLCDPIASPVLNTDSTAQQTGPDEDEPIIIMTRAAAFNITTNVVGTGNLATTTAAPTPQVLARKRRREMLEKSKQQARAGEGSSERSSPPGNHDISSPQKNPRDVPEQQQRLITNNNNNKKRTVKTNVRYDPDTPMNKEETAAWRREKRRVRNRESAAASRQKTKSRIEELEQELQSWKDRCREMQFTLKLHRLADVEAVNSSTSSNSIKTASLPSFPRETTISVLPLTTTATDGVPTSRSVSVSSTTNNEQVTASNAAQQLLEVHGNCCNTTATENAQQLLQVNGNCGNTTATENAQQHHEIASAFAVSAVETPKNNYDVMLGGAYLTPHGVQYVSPCASPKDNNSTETLILPEALPLPSLPANFHELTTSSIDNILMLHNTAQNNSVSQGTALK